MTKQPTARHIVDYLTKIFPMLKKQTIKDSLPEISEKFEFDIHHGQFLLIVRDIKLRGRRIHRMGDAYVRFHHYGDLVPAMYFYRLPKSQGITAALIDSQDYLVHPHLSEGNPCLGAFNAQMAQMIDSQYLPGFFMLVKQYLSNWNLNSAYYNINRFHTRKIEFENDSHAHEWYCIGHTNQRDAWFLLERKIPLDARLYGNFVHEWNHAMSPIQERIHKSITEYDLIRYFTMHPDNRMNSAQKALQHFAEIVYKHKLTSIRCLAGTRIVCQNHDKWNLLQTKINDCIDNVEDTLNKGYLYLLRQVMSKQLSGYHPIHTAITRLRDFAIQKHTDSDTISSAIPCTIKELFFQEVEHFLETLRNTLQHELGEITNELKNLRTTNTEDTVFSEQISLEGMERPSVVSDCSF